VNQRISSEKPRQPPRSGGYPLPAPLARRLTYLLFRVSAAAGRKAAAALEPLGIDTRHYSVLTVLEATPAPSQRSIAETLGIDRATLVGLTDSLVGQGLVRRTQSRTDRRANRLSLTPKGRELLARAHALMDDCEAAFVQSVPDADRAALAALLQQLLAANT
jgi:DNA-binding MarR family transcriptional regulator